MLISYSFSVSSSVIKRVWTAQGREKNKSTSHSQNDSMLDEGVEFAHEAEEQQPAEIHEDSLSSNLIGNKSSLSNNMLISDITEKDLAKTLIKSFDKK